MQGGAFRLPNGNTFITDADDARIIEVTSSGEIEYDYSWPGNTSMIARAMKYSSEFFDNTLLCADTDFVPSANSYDLFINGRSL